MTILDLPITEEGSDIDFSIDALVTGIAEYRQAVLLRLSHVFTFDRNADGSPKPFGMDLMAELGTVGGDASLGVRASAAIQNDDRFTAQLTALERNDIGGVLELSLSFQVIVDETQETFSLDVLVANGEVRLVP